MRQTARRLVMLFCASCACVSALALAARAQAQRSPNVDRSQAMQRRVNIIEKDAARMPARQDPAAARQQMHALAQVREDFKRMQAVNNEMMRAVVSGRALDYALISETTAEIRKRAGRLRSNLALPRVDDSGAKKNQAPPVAVEADRMKPSLLQLDALIMSFIGNPMFQKPGVVDAEQSTKASRDLAGIIELSEQIRRAAERLHKAAPRQER